MFRKMKKFMSAFLTALMVFSSALIPMAPLIANAAGDSPGESVVSDSGIDGTGADSDSSIGTENAAGNNNEGESTAGEEAGNSDAGDDADNGNKEVGDDADNGNKEVGDDADNGNKEVGDETDNGNEEAGDEADGVVGAENEQNKSVSGEEQSQAAEEKSMSIVPFVLNRLELNDGYVVTFMLGSDVFSKVGVKVGEYCSEPAPPVEPAEMSFRGWYLDSAGAGDSFDFANTQIKSDITLYAKFDSGKYQVKFMDADGLVFATIQVEQGGELTEDAVKQIDHEKSVPKESVFKYWYIDDSTANPGQVSIALPYTVTGNLVLKPHFVNQYSLVFMSEGTQVGAQIYVAGDIPTAPTPPDRKGYTFNEWVDNNQVPFSFSAPLEKDVVLYATWTPVTNAAEYVVVYWLEKPNFQGTPTPGDPDHYVFAYSENKTGTPGDSIDVDAISPDAASGSIGLQYAELQEPVNDVVINADGTTVLNVYCERKTYTLKFNLNDNNGNTTMGFNGVTYYGNTEPYEFKAKFEQDISKMWPCEETANLKHSGNKTFQRWGKEDDGSFWTTTQHVLTRSLLPSNPNESSVSLLADWQNAKIKQVVNYWIERLDEQVDDIAVFNGIEYVKDYSNSQNLNNAILVHPKELKEGLTYYHPDGYDENKWEARWEIGVNKDRYVQAEHEFRISDDGGINWQPEAYEAFWEYGGSKVDYTNSYYHFLYNRNLYTLSFNTMGGTAIAPMPDIKYEKKLDGYEPVAPTKDGYDFDGWYLGANYDGAKFEFLTERMPAYDLTLFAKWESASDSARLTVNFYDSVTSVDVLDSQKVNKNDYAVPYAGYTIGETVEGKGVFRNWLWKDENGKYAVYDLTTMPVTDDLELYADWQNGGYKITYDLGGGTGTVPADPDQYAAGVVALVLPGSDLVYGDLLFAGWQIDGTGDVYYPGSTIEVTRDINLVARYRGGGDNPNTITVIFEANYTGGPSQIRWLCSNDDDPLTLLTAAGTVAAGWSERSGYTLLHWTLGTEDEEPIFDLGGEYTFAALGLDGGSEITLYAQWQENEPEPDPGPGPGPGPDPDTLTVIYEANYTDGPSPISLLISKEDDPTTLLTTAGTVAAGWPERPGYTLLHWTLTVENADPTFTLGGEYSFAELGLDGGSEIILYAQWQFIPSDGGTNGRGGRSTTSTSTPTPTPGPDEQNIEPNPTPLPPFPEPEPVNPPTEEPEVVEVPVENVPLVDLLPKTGAGGTMFLWLLGLGASLAGTVFILRRKQRV